MNYTGPYCYELYLSEERGIIHKKQNGEVVKFSQPSTESKRPKIYIIQQEHKIIYVGYASQSIGSRLSGGLRAHGKNGYHGYGWKKLEKVYLTVFVFTPFDGNEKRDKEHRLFVEAIEAELVFLARQKTGLWPKYQSEIHFNNERLDEVRQVADEIYKSLLEEDIRNLWDEFGKAGHETSHKK